jgi:hypothetical protein
VVGGFVVALGVTVFVWFGTIDVAQTADAPVPATPAEARQQAILENNLDRPGDPLLAVMYQEINARHFDGALPIIPVVWEPALATVGELAGGEFSLEGMYGFVGSRALILLTPELQADRRALERVLCHEMVHAYLHTIGNSTTTHGPAFQTILRRLSLEGAFEGVVATDEERRSLRAQLDREAARLDAEAGQLRQLDDQLQRERLEVERAMAELSASSTPDEVARVMSRRDAYNERAVSAGRRSEQHQRDRQALDSEVARYNLMIAYPDGIG